MPLDGISIRCLTEELSSLGRAAVQKIHQPQRNELLFALYGGGRNVKLLISVNPSNARIQLTEEKIENPQEPPMFCRLLRKHLTGASLCEIHQPGLERVLDLVFSARSELEERVERHLLVELCGRNSNIILTDGEYKIFDSLRHVDLSMNTDRTILPGFTYTFLCDKEKTDVLSAPKDELVKTDSFKAQFIGFSPLAEREAEIIGIDVLADLIKENKFSPCVLYDENEKPVDFWAFEPVQYGPLLKIRQFDSISAAMDEYYSVRAAKERLQQKSQTYKKLIQNHISRAQKKLTVLQKELYAAENRDEYKKMGELITANLYRLSKGQKIVEVEDYYTEGTPVIRIPVDAQLTPSENAQRYFKKYNKAKTAQIKLSEQIENTIQEISYLESVLQEINQAESTADLSLIYQELTEEGYIKSTDKKKRKDIASGPIEKEYEGYTIFVGKNNKQNDYLTLKTARANDMWMHVKDMPGSHVIIKTQNEEFPDRVLEYAAELAAFYSKAGGAPKTEIDYTLVKNVKKPTGAKPGMVIYDPYYTLITKGIFNI